MMHANHREEVEDGRRRRHRRRAWASSRSRTGDTLAAPDAPIKLETIEFPEPVIKVAIEPKTKADQEKMSTALGRLAEEDPTFQVQTNEETGQTEISGMGELHLEVLVDRMLREFKVDANVGRPAGLLPRDHPRRGAQGRGQVRPPDRRLGPVRRGQHRPRAGPRRGLRLRQQDPGRLHPHASSSPPSRRASRRRWRTASKAGYPIVDVRVTLVDGKYHDVDSSEIAFKVAGSLAFQEAAKRAKPVLLEPVFSVEVVTPEEFVGDVIGDLSRRRGHCTARSSAATRRWSPASVPLAEMFGYATDLRTHHAGPRDLHDAVREVRGGPAEHRRGDRRAPDRGAPSRPRQYLLGVRPQLRLTPKT